MSYFQEVLERMDESNSEKSDYMALILQILYENWTSKEDTETIQNAIYSYDQAR